MTMYVRVSPLSVVRVGGKCSKATFLVILAITILTIFCFLALVTDNRISDTELFYRQIELPTWGVNQSVLLEDYIDPANPDSFIWQPTASQEYFNRSSRFCGPAVKVLILVASAPVNFEQRRAIRETWGSPSNLLSKGVRLVFVLGNSDSTSVEDNVSREARNYDDIIEENFMDSYHNLTLKSMVMLKWVNLTCSLTTNNTSSAPQFILKTDDDIFINVDRLLKVAHDMPRAKMIGRLTCGATPIGDWNSKLYMPKYLYPGRVYPGYLSGTGYMIRGNIIPTLLRNAHKTPLIHLEDIYVTALLARQSRIYPDDSSFFTYSRIDPKDNCAFRFMVNSHQLKPNELRYIWSNMKKPATCSPKNKWIRKIPRLSNRLRSFCLFS